MSTPSNRRPPIFETNGVPFAEGETDPACETLMARFRRTAWPSSLFGRWRFARHLRKDQRSEAEEHHRVRLATIASGRDIGERADVYTGADGQIAVEPPHRGVGLTWLTRAVRANVLGLSQAITAAATAGERVRRAETRAREANHAVEQARANLPAPPATGEARRVVVALLVVAFTAIEGIGTKVVWEDITDDTRLGVLFAFIFAVAVAVVAHQVAKWLWALADSYDRSQETTLALVAVTFVTAIGMLVVVGIERDRILVSNLAADQAQRQNQDQASLTARSGLAAALPQTDAQVTPGAPPAGAGLGAAVTGAGPSGGLSQAVPDSAAPALAPSPSLTPRAGTSGGTLGNESYRFVLWLNILVFLALLILYRSHSVSTAYHDAREDLDKLEADAAARRSALQAAEETHQDQNVALDYAERVLFPLAEEYSADEADLDRLFVDQIERAAVAADHGRVTVRLTSEPQELVSDLTRMLTHTLPTLSPTGVNLGSVPYSDERVSETLSGLSSYAPTTDPAPPFPPRSSDDGSDSDEAPTEPAEPLPADHGETARTIGDWLRRRRRGERDADAPVSPDVPPSTRRRREPTVIDHHDVFRPRDLDGTATAAPGAQDATTTQDTTPSGAPPRDEIDAMPTHAASPPLPGDDARTVADAPPFTPGTPSPTAHATVDQTEPPVRDQIPDPPADGVAQPPFDEAPYGATPQAEATDGEDFDNGELLVAPGAATVPYPRDHV